LAGFKSAGVIVEIMNEDGTMARLPQLAKVAEIRFKLVSIEACSLQNATRQFDYRRNYDIETRFGTFRLRAYEQTTNKQIHIALTKGTWNLGDAVLTESSSVNNDLLGQLIMQINNWTICLKLMRKEKGLSSLLIKTCYR
jgi:3,4-dihydroxy 2-butanone 4-phosphate synthase/GTP cyclohydrolase II